MLYEPATGNTFQNSSEFRAANPHTSYGDLVDEAGLNAVGLFTLVESRPSCDYSLFDCVADKVVQDGERYLQTYVVVPKSLSPEQVAAITLAKFDAALTAHLDATAQARRYDDRKSCALRAGYPGPFQAEGLAFATWMDACNAMAYQLLTLVQQGEAPMPPSVEAFISSLPVMVWPS